MNILYIHQYFKFPNEFGGTRSFDLATEFVVSGHHVEVITSTSDGKYKTDKTWTKIEQNGLVVHYMYLPYGNHLSYFRRSLVFLQFIYFSTLKLLSLKADIVLATSTPLTIGIPALIKKWIHKTPFVFEVRDVWPEAVIAIGVIKSKILQKMLYKLEHFIYNNAAAIVPLSEDMKRSIVSRYPELSKKPIEVIENISEINRFQNNYKKESHLIRQRIGIEPRFIILYAGTFGRVNGIGYVIEFAEKLFRIDPSIVFVLIGDGAEKESVIRSVKNKEILNKTVFILDPIPKESLPQFYSECDMGSSFVIPVKAFWANSANKFFDTLAASKPILINYEGWQKEVIENENIGFVLPEVLDNVSICNFAKYTKNKLLIEQQSFNALNLAKNRYSLTIAKNKYLSIFSRIK